MATPGLTPEQLAEADRLEGAILQACRADIRRLAELLATKGDHELLGATEFQVRDAVLGIGAKAIGASLGGRKKGATKAPPGPARTAAGRPGSSATAPSG